MNRLRMIIKGLRLTIKTGSWKWFQGGQSVKLKKVCTNITLGVGYLATGILISYLLMSTAADQQAKIEAQLSKCRGGNFCQVEANEKLYRFLTISARTK